MHALTGPSAGKDQLATAWFHLEGSTARLLQFRRCGQRQRTGPIKAYLKSTCGAGVCLEKIPGIPSGRREGWGEG